MNTQYVWIAIVIVGIVGGIEIGYGISSFHNSYMTHHHFSHYDGWHQYGKDGGYMMQSWCNEMMNNHQDMMGHGMMMGNVSMNNMSNMMHH